MAREFFGRKKRFTTKQRKLLRKIAEAYENKTPFSMTEACRSIGCSTKVYYRLIEDPVLGEQLPKAIDEILAYAIIPILQITIRRAMEGSAKHSEQIYKLSGLFPSSEGGGGTRILQIFNNKSDESLDVIQARVEQYLLGYVERGRK